jgi:iron(III) transport system permease protein
MIPLGFPGIIIAVGLLWAFLQFPLGVYGTIWAVILGFLIRYLPTGVRAVSGTVVQIHSEMEEAGRICGGSWATTFRNVFLPLCKAGLVSALIYIFVNTFKELSVPILLVSTGSEVLSVVMWDLWAFGDAGRLAALGVIMMTILWSIIAVLIVILRGKVRFS